MKLSGLYAIVDVDSLAARSIDPIAFARDVLVAKPGAMQLRAKSGSDAGVASLARSLASLCRTCRVPFVLNDRVDLARAIECDLVHLGQGDAPETARGLTLGISTHTPMQLERALRLRPTYVAYGPVFTTASKKNPDPVVGLAGLAQARAIVRASPAPKTPLVAIGGISLENAGKIAEFADAGAVIGALVGDDVTARARAMHAALGGAR